MYQLRLKVRFLAMHK